MREQTWLTRRSGLIKRAAKVLSLGIVLTGVFLAGHGVGNGTITFSNQSPVRQEGLAKDLNYESVEKVYDTLRLNFDGTLDQKTVLEGLKKGLVQAAGDAYTEYLNQEQTKELDEDLSGTFSGIGAELSKEGDSILVVSPIIGFPAEKAGLKPQDIITKINDESTFGLNLSEAVKKIRGPKGSKVKLTVIRNKSEEISLDITRDNITISSVKYEIREGNIGYIQISRFGEDTTKLTREAAAKLAAAKVKGVVLDVRGNPGGFLDSAVAISSLWLSSDKTVLQEKRSGIVVKTFHSDGTASLRGVPTIVLINTGSASASEIVAGALKDNKAATLWGEKTFGKGSVQQIERLKDGSAIKVTIARWYTPSGRNIDKEGIEPDTKITQSTADTEKKVDTQLEAALGELRR